MHGSTFKGNVSSRAHKAHQELPTDFLTDVFSGFFSLTSNEENPMWARRNSRERLFKSSWRQFGLLSCLDDKTMQECVSCMKVRRCETVLSHIFVLQSMTFKELHRCNHLPKVQPSSEKDPLGQHCTSWTWALHASQMSKMTLSA